MAATTNPLAEVEDVEAGPAPEPQQEQSSSGQRLADVSVVQFQLRFLARLHKPCIGHACCLLLLRD